MMTAVSGSMAPKIEVRVGPMCLIALIRAMLEMAVAGKASPNIYSHVPQSVTIRIPLVKQPHIIKRRAPIPIT